MMICESMEVEEVKQQYGLANVYRRTRKVSLWNIGGSALGQGLDWLWIQAGRETIGGWLSVEVH